MKVSVFRHVSGDPVAPSVAASRMASASPTGTQLSPTSVAPRPRRSMARRSGPFELPPDARTYWWLQGEGNGSAPLVVRGRATDFVATTAERTGPRTTPRERTGGRYSVPRAWDLRRTDPTGPAAYGEDLTEDDLYHRPSRRAPLAWPRWSPSPRRSRWRDHRPPSAGTRAPMARPRETAPRAHQPEPGIGRARSLRVDSTPTSVARWRSRDMIERDYFSHDIPGYGRLQAPRSGRATATCWPARTSAGTRTSTTRHGRDPRHVHGLVRPSAQHPRAALGGDRRRRRVQGVRRQEDVDRPVRGQVRSHGQGGTRATPRATPSPSPGRRRSPRPGRQPGPRGPRRRRRRRSRPRARRRFRPPRRLRRSRPFRTRSRRPTHVWRRRGRDCGSSRRPRVAACSRRSWAASPVSSSAHDDRGGY